MLRRRLPEGSRESIPLSLFPYTPPGVDVLEGGMLTSNNVAGSSHGPFPSFTVASGAVSEPGSDAARQNALYSANVE